MPQVTKSMTSQKVTVTYRGECYEVVVLSASGSPVFMESLRKVIPGSSWRPGVLNVPSGLAQAVANLCKGVT